MILGNISHKVLQIGCWLLIFADHYLNLSNRFSKVGLRNLDIQFLYNDFMSSNLDDVNKAIAVFGVRSAIHCSLLCLTNSSIQCKVFSHSFQDQSCFLFPNLNSRCRNFSILFARNTGRTTDYPLFSH